MQSAAMTHEISGDVRLSTSDRLRYLWRNAHRNLSSLGRGPTTRPFRPQVDAIPSIGGQSPSRYLTEAFIATELARLLPPTGPVEVLEIGCGSGSMAARLERVGYHGRYVGADISNRFKMDTGPLERIFYHGDANDVEPRDPINLLISVSALEHIPNDTALICRLSGYMERGIQLHFVPARAALATYLWHGYRQYSPADLAERFGATEIIRLGGFGSFLLHLIVITPEMLFGRFVLCPGTEGLRQTNARGSCR